MRVGFVGLGKMGSQIVSKLLAAGHEVVAFDVNQTAVQACVAAGSEGATSREDLIAKLGPNPVVWLMIPADFVQAEFDAYMQLLPNGSILIDGGNSNYSQSMQRAAQAEAQGVSFVDVGTSGGVMGLTNGFSMMVGGTQTAYHAIEPILLALAQPRGAYMYIGPSGYGHYVKMIHNGIEYAIMQAYAEGYDLLKYGPLKHINLAGLAETWQHGSIIDSRLNALIADILKTNPEMEGIDGAVASSGEGQWTYDTAQQANVAMPALRAALDIRDASQHGRINFSTKLLAALRHAFGGHAINKP